MRLRAHILRQDPGDVEDFGVIVGRHQRTPSEGNPMFGPRMKTYEKWDGRKFSVCEMFMGQFTAYFKLDTGPIHPLWTDHALQPGINLKIVKFSPAAKDPAHGDMIQAVQTLFHQGRLKDFD